MRQWLYFDELPERVVDADPIPSPTYAQTTPANAASQSHAGQRGHEAARVVLAILLLLVGVGVWLLLALPVGVLRALLGLIITGALIARALHSLHLSVFWGRCGSCSLLARSLTCAQANGLCLNDRVA